MRRIGRPAACLVPRGLRWVLEPADGGTATLYRLGGANRTGGGAPAAPRFNATKAPVGPAAAGAGQPPPAAAPRASPGLISPSGLPLSSTNSGSTSGAGAEIELTPQNAAQVLQTPGALLLQVGSPTDSIVKKLMRLRVAAGGRLPLVKLDCRAVPQVCQALQIKSQPAVFLMARGQVVAALEDDLSAQATTGFIEQIAQALGLKVDLAEGVSEQLAEAEELEWTDPAAAQEIFVQASSASDLQIDVRVRIAAGVARCMLWCGDHEKARAQVENLESAGHGRVQEVKQAVAMLWLDTRRSASPPDTLRKAVKATPTDFAAVEALAVSLFWGGKAVDAVDAGLKLLRRKKSDEARQLVLALIEALGPRHPKHASSRRAFSNALFV